MKNKLNKIGSIIINLILVMVILITVIIVICFAIMKSKKQKYINVFGYSIMQVVTGSMANTINVKDIVIVKITKDVKNNDIISYEDNNMIITHRVIRMTDKYIVAKGDANNAEDKPITKDKVVGRVVCIIPKVGVWQKVFTAPPVFISGSITIILLYLLYTSKDDKKGNKCLDEKEK